MIRRALLASLLVLLVAVPAQSAVRRAPSMRAKHLASPVARAPRADGLPRRLEDIHIEGEIPTPQVLFITARDQRRFLDLQDRRYLKTAQELADSTRLPAQILVNRVRPAHDKENPR